MTTRPFNVIRRKANLVDILIPKQAGVQGYRLRNAANFDAAYADLLTADISSGYLGSTVDRRTLSPINSRDFVRIAFDPDDEGLTDTAPFWLRFQPVDFGGTPGTESIGMMILPEDAHGGDRRVVIRGNAPNAASIADSLEIGLPFRAMDIVITNHDSADELLVATLPGGYEYQIASGGTTLEIKDGPLERLFVRGDSAVVDFSATFTGFLPL